MKALLQYAPYDNRYQEVDTPVAGEGELLLAVKGCGICAGDLKAYHGGERIWGTSEVNRYIEPPVIGGHEFFGEIVARGKGCDAFQVGDLVCVEQIAPCNVCDFCKQGKYWMCQQSAVYGFKQHIAGGFAQFVKIHKNSLVHKIPAGFTPQQAALIEPLACGMHAIDLANIQHEDTVVIAGLGAIGVAMVNMAKLRLPKCIIGLDIKEHRLQMGQSYGADFVLNPLKASIEQELDAITNGKGCDVYIEASGSPSSVNQGLKLLRNHGRYVQMGVFAKEVQADFNVIGDGKELVIQGSHLSALTFPAVIEGIRSGLLKTEGLISHAFQLEQWEAAFETAEKDPQAMKVMLVP